MSPSTARRSRTIGRGQAIGAGVAFVPAERSVRGTVGPMNVRENLSICDVARFFIGGRLSRRAEVGENKRMDRSAVDQDVGHRGADRLAEWRQSTESACSARRSA